MHSVPQAEQYALGQITHPSQSWKGLCQSFVRHCYGVNSWAPSAYDAWLKIPADKKHTDADFHAIPAGAAVYFKRNHAGQERPGHVVFNLGNGICVSNDIYRSGQVDKCPNNIFIAHWNMAYLGYSFWTPFGFMPKA